MWKPIIADTSQPKYIAIADQLAQDIREGRIHPGERLPTHRELADLVGANVSTITRAYKEAERRRLVAGTVGRGTFVASDACAALDLVRPEGLQTALIEMGLVHPLYGEDEPVAEVIQGLSRNRGLQQYVKYADPIGMPEHRAAGARWVKRFGIEVGPEQVVITAGAQHALACALLACFKPGDRIAVDALTYPGFKTLAGMLAIRLVAILADEHGMLPKALDAACRRDGIKGIFLMPGVQNPTAVHMPAQRREALAQMIKRHGLLLLEDDVYAHTCPETVPAIATWVPEQSILIAGLSKILFAGLRSAYVVASTAYHSLLARAVLNTIWMAPPLNAAIIAECITSGLVEQTLAKKMKEAARRNGLAREILSGCRYRGMDTGYFIWLALPEPWTGSEFEARCRQMGVNIFSAEKFAVSGSAAPAAARISLTGTTNREELTRGLSLVAKLLRENGVPYAPII
jgi:DNA-binding transcriptional MocR family regulator